MRVDHILLVSAQNINFEWSFSCNLISCSKMIRFGFNFKKMIKACLCLVLILLLNDPFLVFWGVKRSCRENWHENGATLKNNSFKSHVHQLEQRVRKEKILIRKLLIIFFCKSTFLKTIIFQVKKIPKNTSRT